MKKIVFCFMGCLLFVNCGIDKLLGLADYEIKYKVTGTAKRVDVTYENEDGGTSQESDCAVPWEYNFLAKSGTWVYVSAQNQEASGTVIVTIYIDDSVFKKSQSSGAYVIATASGTV